MLADLTELTLGFASHGGVVSGALVKNQRETVKRYLQGVDRWHRRIQTKPEVARAVLRESNSDAEVVGPLYERLSKAFRDFPTPEPRGIQKCHRRTADAESERAQGPKTSSMQF
ncbi:MAG TPA: hypothetical protein VFK65_15005 [Candidatus Binatia bacterium]|nr:hypothetical protein [Candidatus Binatia bacterium]